jgi:hypothetical protein
MHVQVFRVLSLNRSIFIILKKNILVKLAASPVVKLVEVA